MAESTQQPIVIKKIRKGGAGGHGGAWKIAYADFVTAMMAFFLLMWLLGSTTQSDLKGISDFFNTPLKIAMQGGRGSGDATSLVQGGGDDLTRSVGQVANADYEDTKRRLPHAKVTPPDIERAERQRFQEVKQRLEAMIEASPVLRQFKNQLLLDITSEGLRIQIIDEKNRPMFDSGASTLKPYTREILHAIAQVLNEMENRVSISGHTDATPYAGGNRGMGNWELSADRANACRRELTVGGLDDDRVARVVGLSSTVPLDPSDLFSASNRRISIVVLNRKAEEALSRSRKTVDVTSGRETSGAAATQDTAGAQAEPAKP
ncbi:flagellar motor protein MotB [Niveibacterium sp. SC-1]|uniref:flagellar motor protein MotB n=1 Tax=Niveibacterium sp. SC-1 TaxID=3135646 RepID=UPI00311EC77B